MLPEPTTTLLLPSGRRLACDDVGDRDGRAVVYLHGAPDSRLARHPDDGIAADLGLRLVAVDRPGYGWSDPAACAPDTFGEDLGLLLDHLGVGSCVLAAWSAGVPSALDAAATLGPERVERVATYGAIAPIEGFADPLVAAASGHRAAMAEAVTSGGVTAEDLADELVDLLVPAPPVPMTLAREQVLDALGSAAVRALDAVPGALDTLARSLAAAVERHGGAGLRSDLVRQFGDGFERRIAAVRCPVVLVHGALDPIAGPAVGRWFAERLANARVEVWSGAGHQGLLVAWARWLQVAAGSET